MKGRSHSNCLFIQHDWEILNSSAMKPKWNSATAAVDVLILYSLYHTDEVQ